MNSTPVAAAYTALPAKTTQDAPHGVHGVAAGRGSLRGRSQGGVDATPVSFPVSPMPNPDVSPALAKSSKQLCLAHPGNPGDPASPRLGSKLGNRPRLIGHRALAAATPFDAPRNHAPDSGETVTEARTEALPPASG